MLQTVIWSAFSRAKCYQADEAAEATTFSGFGPVESVRNNVLLANFSKVGALFILTTEAIHFTGMEKGELPIEKSTLKPYCIIKLRSRL